MRPLILAIAFALQVAAVTPTVVPPRDVQELVTPILDIRAEAEGSQGERQNKAFWRSAELIGKLIDIKTRSSDEALVVLMNFYIGEAPGEDLLHEVTVRGKRMLPLLLKYRNARVTFSQRKYPASVLLAPDVRKENFDEVVKSIRAGKIIGED